MASTAPPSTKLFVFNFPPVPHVYSVCPFAIKLESFLRINQIPHETIHTTKFSSQFTMPYCRLGDPETGEEVTDSNVIIERLQKEYPTGDENLSPMDRAIAHTITRMLEEHTAQIGFYYRYGLDMKSFVDELEIGERFGNPPEFTQRWLEIQPGITKEKTQKRGLTRHADDMIWRFSHDDLQALSHILGDKKFFFGKDAPTTADCVVFGHLSQFLWIPIAFPQQQYLKEQCPNLVRFMEHFRQEYWPDWKECCKKQPNQKFAKKKSALAAEGEEEKKD